MAACDHAGCESLHTNAPELSSSVDQDNQIEVIVIHKQTIFGH